ncbi:MAG: glycerate kinase [Dysgonamonadaceae bacterium]|nr:glycerate kinase [Dysgonamonadaceae bacterium]MDD4729658.1 glycerate kinase [Dysgonamonadaceae bacterium]
MKKIIICPDSFKGSLSSMEVADAIEKGVKNVFPNCETTKIPIADGGEGTTDTLIHALNGERVNVKVSDPLMRPVEVEYGLVNDGNTAIIEMAAASGLTLLNNQEQNPSITTTYGTGEIIKNALERGCRSFLIGIGGSATNDAGTGMLRALGYRFLDKDGKETNGTGKSLKTICSIDRTGVMTELKDAQFTVACDVNNPFSGLNGAAYVYAPQKGANNEMVRELDEGLECFSNLIKKELKLDLNSIAGAGAAGGLGGGFIAFLNAELKPGIQMVLEAVEFEKQLQNAELVITGEGKLDEQTGMGKAASGILDVASKNNVPVIAIGGSVEDIDNLNKRGFVSVFSIQPYPISLEEAMKKDITRRNTTQVTEQFMRVIKQFKNK